MESLDLPHARDRLELAERLRQLPADAGTRGVWFLMTFDHVRKLGEVEAMAWKRATQGRRRVPFLYYPLREYLEELAVAGALTNPSDPAEGIRAIWRGATPAYVSTPFGRTLMRLLRIDPARYMRWLVDNRDHFCNYGSWGLKRHDDTYFTMEMRDEPVWIASAQRGGAEGFLAACGVQGTVEPELTSRCSGRLHIRWTPAPR